MSYELEFEAEPFATSTAGAIKTECGCRHAAPAKDREYAAALDREFTLGGIATALGKAATGLFGGASSRIIDLTAKAEKSLRKATRDPRTVTALVLHQMACCATRKDPLNSYLKINSHYSILRDGRILQMHPISSTLWASHGFNNKSVAVEFAGNFPNTQGGWWKGETYGKNQLTQAQVDAGRDLIQHLVKTIGLKHVLAHRQSSDTRTNDPGPDIWFHVGQWAVDHLKLSDGGANFKIGTGKSIPSEWRTWNKPVTGEIGFAPAMTTELAHDRWDELADGEFEAEEENEARRSRRSAARPSRPTRPTFSKRPSPNARPRFPRQPPRRPTNFARSFNRSPLASSAPCVCPQHGSESIRWLQSSLNQVLGLTLPITGFMSSATRSAVRRFQEQRSLPPDGIAGPEVRRVLIEAKSGAPAEAEPAEPPAPTQNELIVH